MNFPNRYWNGQVTMAKNASSDRAMAPSEIQKVSFAAQNVLYDQLVVFKACVPEAITEGKIDFDGAKLDLGFKVFQTVPSHFKVWDGQATTPDKLAKVLWEHVDNVQPKAKDDDLLYELILKSGLDLNVKVEKTGPKAGAHYRVNDGELIISLTAAITPALVDAILAEKPKKVILLDRAFKNNDQLKTNTHLQMEHEGIELKVV